MAKTLTQKLIEGTRVAASAVMIPLVIGCQTIPVRKFPENHVHGVKYQTFNQRRVPYKTEEQMIHNERYYLEQVEKTPTSLEFMILPFENSSRNLNVDNKKTKITSEEYYLPEKVIISGGATKEGYVDQIELMSVDSKKTGVRGIKADILTKEEIREMAKTSKNNYGYKVITTEDGASFAIKTIKILRKEYFIPHVSDSETGQKGKLDFYLVPVEGSYIKIKNICGNITIFNKDNIYRPVLISKEKIDELIGPGQVIKTNDSQ
jgi:hypothetical protein